VSLRTKLRAQSGAEHPDESTGRIAFRLRIGVTGHRELTDETRLTGLVKQELRRLVGLLPASSSTIVELVVISQLADGADRLVVRTVLDAAKERGQQAGLEVVLPMPRDAYVRAQKFDASREKFYELLEQASLVSEPRHAGEGHSHHTAHAYEAAGRRLIASCDVLLAIWNGQPSRGRGGTAETLLAAASMGRPCVWIPTDPAVPVADNYAPGTSYDFYRQVAERSGVPKDRADPLRKPAEMPEDVLEPLRESLVPLECYNGERLPVKFGARLRERFLGGEENWIAPFSLRASMLAAKNRSRFVWSARVITLLAIIAAASLGVHLSLTSNPAWDWADVACLVAITVIFFILRKREFHDRWISYRLLAERLRSARYLIPAGVDFTAGVDFPAGSDVQLLSSTVTAYIEQHPSDWIQRAYDEFRRGARQRRQENAVKTDDDALKRRLSDEWIGRQIAYHRKASRDHRRWQRILERAIRVLFAAALICAILDATVVDRPVTGRLSVAFPAAGASLGALLTVRQHRQLAERSDKMIRDLEDAQWQIRTAVDHSMIVVTALSAAGIMAEESEGWLGALWYLDVEHPG
jgi:SMODS and SLOG-associating 2TM effector domain 1